MLHITNIFLNNTGIFVMIIQIQTTLMRKKNTPSVGRVRVFLFSKERREEKEEIGNINIKTHLILNPLFSTL